MQPPMTPQRRQHPGARQDWKITDLLPLAEAVHENEAIYSSLTGNTSR